MNVGMIGLGKMGSNMVRRLKAAGHTCIVYDKSQEALNEMKKEGNAVASSMGDLVKKLSPTKVIWMMVPANVVDSVLTELSGACGKGDIIIDGGNSDFRDALPRAEKLIPKGISYVDVGTSGGIWGLERGYCLMIGGPKEAVTTLDPIFRALAPEAGYLYCGPNGAGHFVKMVHNGIEYGLMAAYSEGFNLLHKADKFQFNFDLAQIAEVWRHGSVISSWLLDLTASALKGSSTLQEFSEKVADSGEGRWTLEAGLAAEAPLHVLSAALFSRFDSRGNAEFQNKLLSAMRFGFGGHPSKKENEK